MIRRTVAVTVRVVVRADTEQLYREALDYLRGAGPPVSFLETGPRGRVSIDRVIQSHWVEVEPEQKRGKR